MSQVLPDAGCEYREHGVADGREVFLSICIPTYNRAPKLARSLAELDRLLAASAWRGEVELLISDNESSDDTSRVIGEAVERLGRHCPVRWFRQRANLGAEPNFRFLYEQAHGEYVWICSDDDLVSAPEFERLVADLHRYAPQVCISSFANPDSSKDRVSLDPGEEVRVVDDLEAAVRAARRYGMVTQYVLRRHAFTPEEQRISEEASTRVVWFAAMGLMLFARREPRMLLRTGEIARDYADGTPIRFSPRVYGMIRDSVLAGLDGLPEKARMEKVLPPNRPEVSMVGHLFWTALGRGKTEPEIADADFRYLLDNLWSVTTVSWRNIIKMPVVLALFPVARRIRRRRARGSQGRR